MRREKNRKYTTLSNISGNGFVHFWISKEYEIEIKKALAGGTNLSILRTVLANRGNFPAKFRTFGTVRTVHKLDLKAEVSGRVSKLHPQFLIGGEIPAGATLLTMDQTDLRLSLKQAEASLELSNAQLRDLETRIRKRSSKS